MKCYEEMIQNTATKEAPWYVVPADYNWLTSVVVASTMIDALADVDLHYPEVSKEKLKALGAVKREWRVGR